MVPAPEVSPELAAAANCAGAFLLFVLFLLLAVTMVALHLTWRGLATSRRSLPEAMALTLDYIGKLQSGTATTAEAFVGPQVTLASRLAGLQVGLRTLVYGPRASRAPGVALPAPPVETVGAEAGPEPAIGASGDSSTPA
jgi:hypothetical protein